MFNTSANAVEGFYKGQKVTCIYNGVFSWSNGEEFTKTIQVECVVLEASKFWQEYSPNYQFLKVNCKEGLKDKWDNGPGTGLVKDHKINKVERWYTSDECSPGAN